jgi:arabinose-5-phosphate isomerase
MTHSARSNLRPIAANTGGKPSIVQAGQAVLTAESAALAELAKSLGQDFAAAVTTLSKVSGRVIVSGMGKSGHVGNKIAATLASTGTPAQFVHPAEASHGDLGMITKNDAVIAISNSGETAELSDLIVYCKRFQILLIAITKNSTSALGSAADICLTLPTAPEACPMGLAPTTSTTMTLALGDALAVALLEEKGFGADQFRQFHPGGKLGQRLLKIEAIMHHGAEVPIAKPTDIMSDVLLIMTAKRFGTVGIVNPSGQLMGIITDGDLRRHMQDDLLHLTAAEVMTKNPITITPDSLAVSALAIMQEKSITCLFVADQAAQLRGIVHIHDLLRAGVA